MEMATPARYPFALVIECRHLRKNNLEAQPALRLFESRTNVFIGNKSSPPETSALNLRGKSTKSNMAPVENTCHILSQLEYIVRRLPHRRKEL